MIRILLALACAIPLLTHAMPIRVTRVIDGDTLLTHSADGRQLRIRLRAIDAPELSSAKECERRIAAASRDALAGLVQGATVDMMTHGLDRYGRTLATLTLDGQDVGRWMVDHGHAKRYRAASRGKWC